jgi:hypothetical protein
MEVEVSKGRVLPLPFALATFLSLLPHTPESRHSMGGIHAHSAARQRSAEHPLGEVVVTGPGLGSASGGVTFHGWGWSPTPASSRAAGPLELAAILVQFKGGENPWNRGERGACDVVRKGVHEFRTFFYFYYGCGRWKIIFKCKSLL